jgi:hypothetical protein
MAETVATPDKDGSLMLISAKSVGEYQLVTDPIACETNRSYVVRVKADVTEGGLGVGVLDMVKQTWIATEDITSPGGELDFKGSENCKVQIILYNDNPSPAVTRAKISEVKLSPES